MDYSDGRFKKDILKNYIFIFYFLSFILPFFIFLRTMNSGSFGWDTTWLHIQVPLLYVGQTTGFPIAFLTGKLFSFLPIGTMAFRLNMFSVFWGAMTLLVLFIFIKNLLKNEYFIAFVSVMFFGFYRVFWLQTTRLEVYTLSTFFTAIIMLTGFYWSVTKSNKFLYLFYFLIGLSFTNHPISLFLAPAFILFPVYTEWRQVFRIKKVFIIIALIIAPNLLYLYIPIRSFQGYGNVTTLPKFLDYISGENWKSDFGFKGFEMLKKLFLGYVNLMKGEFTIVVLIIFIIGLVYLAIYKRKFFILIISLIIFNMVPVLLYVQTATHFYLTTMVCFFCLPFAAGLFWIKESIVWFFNRFLRRPLSGSIKFLAITDGKNTNGPDNRILKSDVVVSNKEHDKRFSKKFIIIRAVFLIIFFIAISIFPANLFALNFNQMDMSKDTYAYDYWLDVLTKVKSDSIIISNSLTSHIPIYIDMFETKKNIQIIRNVNLDDIRRIVKENIDKKDIYYTDVYLPDLTQYYSVSQFGGRFFMEGFKENFLIYKVDAINVDVEITTASENLELSFGKKTRISFLVKNNSSVVLNINSIELKLPKALKFIEISPDSDMKSAPGMAQGTYMWTAGPYKVEPGAVYNLSFDCQASAKVEGEIEFRITTGNMFVEGPKIKFSTK